MLEWFSIVVIATLSYAFTASLRRYALSKSLLDIPNARSSHSIPTPRGGGVAIVVVFLAALPWFWLQGHVESAALAGAAGAGALVAVIGFMDDHGHIAARWRLLGHFLAALWALVWLGGLAPVSAFGMSIDLGIIGHVLAAFYLVWMLNLYNFMDGIDGIASVEAVTVCGGMSLIYLLGGHAQLFWSPLLLAAATLGFLIWNFPPARIFMGDAGSGFLGIILGILSLQAAWVAPQLFWAWLVLLGVFVVDATLTLLRRLLRGDKVYEAHRSHAYQFASRRFGRHLPVTLAVGAINLLWLLPVAAWVALLGGDGPTGVAIAWLPLAVLAFRFNAGALERI